MVSEQWGDIFLKIMFDCYELCAKSTLRNEIKIILE
jgi:hypothetical protein